MIKNKAKKTNDNRMGWIRNIEKIKESNVSSDCYEYEIVSECKISALLDYDNGSILFSIFSPEKDEKGLYHYYLRIKYAKRQYNQNANRKGYYFKDGILGELLGILSLFFQCRFYLTATCHGEFTDHSIRTKIENNFLYYPCDHKIHPQVFSNNKALYSSRIHKFLDSTRSINPEYHQKFILACHLYSRALKEIGIDNEMVYIKLVSSIESLSQLIALEKKDDIFKGKSFDEIFKNINLEIEEKEGIKKTLEVRKSKKKFVRFIEKYSKGFFKGGNYKARHTKIKKMDLCKILSAIYDARSSYLHAGKPMYISNVPIGSSYGWDTEPSYGMIIDNRTIPVSEKLPYTYFFESLVRHCLFNFIKDKTVK